MSISRHLKGVLICITLAFTAFSQVNAQSRILTSKIDPGANSFSNFNAVNQYSKHYQSYYSSEDSVLKQVNKKARNRALQSAILPGLGQINNGQIWKVPLVWGGLGLATYNIIENHQSYKQFAKAYRLRVDGDSTTIDQYDPITGNSPVYSSSALKDARETFRRNRTLSILTAFLVYAANVVDAYVYAHLQDFDVSDDLTMNVNPPKFANIANHNTISAGITIKLKP